MMKDFKIDLATVQWATTGYLLLIAVIMLASPYLNVRFTAKQLFSAASIAFICGSLICFVSSNFALLLIGRLISSLGAGLATPLMFNLIVEIMPQKSGAFIWDWQA